MSARAQFAFVVAAALLLIGEVLTQTRLVGLSDQVDAQALACRTAGELVGR